MAAANSKRLRNLTLDHTLPYILILGGLVGLVASFLLTHDKLKVLQDPAYDPFCNINPIFSCGSVMKTEQASLLGMPNTIFGVAAFTALITFGFLLAAGSVVKKWLWQAAQVAATIGVIFMHYLFFQGVYRINAVCPWCFVVWMVTIPIFWYITLYNLRHGYVRLPKRFARTNDFLQANHGNILISWYMIILGIILERFWFYWSTLL